VDACPLCDGRELGRIGPGQFYCWRCCCELTERPGGALIHRLDPDGTLVPMGHSSDVQSRDGMDDEEGGS